MKYRKGMKVRCLNEVRGEFTTGREYVVRADSNEMVRVVADDGGNENGWDGSNFEIISEASARDEFEAMRKCSEALEALSEDQRGRVICYLDGRFG